MHPPSRVAFSTLAFPDATLASAVSLGRRWSYAGVELRLLAQVKDARRGRAGDWQLVLLGEGDVPVRQMLGLLAAGGYRNWISVEWEKRWHPEIEAPEVALPQYRRVLAEWMEVGP
jgi:hypothetical protein